MRMQNKKIASKSKHRTLFRKILRIIIFLLTGIVGIVLLITGYFYLDRDDIGRRVLLYTNDLTQGELSFEDITFNPLKHFPDMSLLLKDVVYYENPVGSRNQNEKSVYEIGRLYAAMDILELISGKIKVSKVTLQNGNIRLVRYPDSTLNLMNALVTYEQKAARSLPDSSGTEFDHELDLHLEQISLYNIQIEYDDRVEIDKEALLIKKMMASFSIAPEMIQSEVETDIELQMISLSEKIMFSNKELSLETAFRFQREAGILLLEPSKLSIDQASVNISGDIDFNSDYKFNIQVDGSDQDFSLFQMVLSKEGLKNLEQGDMYFRGDIIGNPGQEIPLADFAFGLEDVTLYVPRANDYIRDLNLSGRFNSGPKGDLSAAILDIDTVLAKLPRGYLNAGFHMENFMSPEIDLVWDLEGSLSGLEKILKLELFDTLMGELDTECKLLGARIDLDSNRITADVFTMDVACKDLSISIPDVISIQKIDGNIYFDKDTTWFEDINVLTGNTDFLINGVVYNALYLPAKVEHDIMADLQIQSEIFDMPEFLSFVPALREDFPYRIRDIDLDVVVSSSTSEILDFEKNPYLDFDIRHLDATIVDFLPRIIDMSGNFILDEKYRRTFLDFRGFEFDMLESSLIADMELHSPAKKRSFIKLDVETRNLNPGKIFWSEAGDSIPDFLNGLLNGAFRLDIHFPHDESTRLEKVDLREADLHFVNITDTFETRSLNMLATEVYWNNDKDNNLFESLDADIQLGMDSLLTDYFHIGDVDYIIDIQGGEFKVSTKKARILSRGGAAEYVLAPFAEMPYFKLNYKVEGFQVSEILTAFKTDTVFSGTMDLSMDLSSEGRNKEELLHSLNGELTIYGDDLLLFGIDLDEVIKKFKRSQNFNLVDLGAVVLAGPAGLAVTKGGNYAAMLVTNFGDTSHITEIVSDWHFDNGVIMLRDVAFSTDASRVAAKGWLDYQRDSLEISFAVIDKRGCSIIGQDLYGHTKDPEKSKVKVISTLLAPVTNLLDLALDKDCEPFYSGRVKHPGGK